jgi:hypothetical protein
MASRKRIDIEKCEDFVRFEELEGGDVACTSLSACCARIDSGKSGEYL